MSFELFTLARFKKLSSGLAALAFHHVTCQLCIIWRRGWLRHGGLRPKADAWKLNVLQEIKAEPRGDYYIGRRYYVRRIHTWGYLRRPGQPWSSAKVVIMNESSKRVPDRLPEYGTGKIFGFDHNYEYKIRGSYTGRTVYDPNSNARLPEFRPTSFEVLEKTPGFLFKPGQRYNPGLMPQGLNVEPR